MSRQHDTVTALCPVYCGPGELDDPQPFVTEHHARRRPGTAVIHVQVSPAQRAGGDPDHHIVIPLSPGVPHILDSHLAGRLEHDSSHACLPDACTPTRTLRRRIA